MEPALTLNDLTAKKPANRSGAKNTGINVKKFHESAPS